MSSREEFLRSLGITADDTRNPEEYVAPSRSERSALRTQQGNTASAGAASSSSASSSMPTRKPLDYTPSSSSSSTAAAAAAARTYRQPAPEEREQESPPSRPMRRPIDSETTPVSAPSAASASASASGPGGMSRADFLRSLGIDNVDGGDAGAAAAAGGGGASREVPSSYRSSAPETAASSSSSRVGPRGGDASSFGARGAPAGGHVGDAGTAWDGTSMSALRGGSTGGLNDSANSSQARAGDYGASTLGNSQRRAGLDSSYSSTSGLNSSTSAVPLRDIAGNEVPIDTPADDLKKHGNAFYEAGDFRKAVRFYSRAIDKAPQNEVLYSNRSAAYLLASKQMAIDTRTMALRDADKAIELRPQWFKGYSRRGDALFKLERFDEACDAYRDALERDPSNAAIVSSLEQCRACCAPRRDSSLAWSQPMSMPTPSSRAPAGGSAAAGGGASGYASSSRAGGGYASGDSSFNSTSRSAHEMMEEFRRDAERATGSSRSAASYREEQLARFRAGRQATASGGGNDSSVNTSTSSSAAAASGGGGSPSYYEGGGGGGGGGSGAAAYARYETEQFSSNAAANYQAQLMENYRRKKAMQQE